MDNVKRQDEALLSGEHMIRGFSNPDIRGKLNDSTDLKDIADTWRSRWSDARDADGV